MCLRSIARSLSLLISSSVSGKGRMCMYDFFCFFLYAFYPNFLFCIPQNETFSFSIYSKKGINHIVFHFSFHHRLAFCTFFCFVLFFLCKSKPCLCFSLLVVPFPSSLLFFAEKYTSIVCVCDRAFVSHSFSLN